MAALSLSDPLAASPPLPKTLTSTVSQHSLIPASHSLPKYIISIHPNNHSSPAGPPLTCIIVPPGREHEYIFTTGLSSLIDSAGSPAYLALVIHPRLSAPHFTYGDQTEITTELTPFIKSITPANSPSVQILTPGPLDPRSIIHSTDTLCVEESDSTRRLFFNSNPNLIQSECTLKDGKVDPLALSFEYHSTMASAPIRFLPNTSAPVFLVVGLGGGALSSFLQAFFGGQTLTVELDQSVATLAQDYFGYTATPVPNLDLVPGRIGSLLHINDGLAIAPPPDTLSGVFLDVDTKDPSVGMSCPPVDFATVEYMTKVKGWLTATGMLVINCSARDKTLRSELCDRVRCVFGGCYVNEGEGDESINVVVVGVSGKAGGVAEGTERTESMCQALTVGEDVRGALEEGVAGFKVWRGAEKKKSRGSKKKKK